MSRIIIGGARNGFGKATSYSQDVSGGPQEGRSWRGNLPLRSGRKGVHRRLLRGAALQYRARQQGNSRCRVPSDDDLGICPSLTLEHGGLGGGCSGAGLHRARRPEPRLVRQRWQRGDGVRHEAGAQLFPGAGWSWKCQDCFYRPLELLSRFNSGDDGACGQYGPPPSVLAPVPGVPEDRDPLLLPQ